MVDLPEVTIFTTDLRKPLITRERILSCTHNPLAGGAPQKA